MVLLGSLFLSILYTKHGKRLVSTNTTGSQTSMIPLRSVEGNAVGRGVHRGYILTLQYSGQQAGGITALISQQCWLGSFGLPMLLVEPFVSHSILSAYPESPDSTPKFSDYYDIEHYSTASTAMGYGQLVTWEEFSRQAPHEVILVVAKFNTWSNVQTLWEANMGSTDECFHYGKTELWDLQNISLLESRKYIKLQALNSYNFCVVKVVFCPYVFASGYIFNSTEMEQVVFGRWSPREVTLVFTMWRGPWFVPNPTSSHPEVCREINTDTNLTDKLLSSPQLIQTAQMYERLFLKQKSSVAVMLRIEHVIDALRPLVHQGNASVKVEFDNCLQDTLAKVDHLKNEGGVLVTADIGKYGSSAWNMKLYKEVLAMIGKEDVFEAVKETVSELYDNRLTFDEWENTFANVTNGTEDRGYIAALQRTLASRADCLVLVGGGSFLKQALREYLHNHPTSSTWCVEVICAIQSSTVQYQEILKNAKEQAQRRLV